MSVEGLTCSFPNISFIRQGDHFVITLLFIVEREGTAGTLVMGSGCIDLRPDYLGGGQFRYAPMLLTSY